MKTIRRCWVRAGFAVGVLLLSAAPALAQNADKVLPPFDVAGLEHKKIWVPWVFAFLFAAGCILIAFKNPRRTHLD